MNRNYRSVAACLEFAESDFTEVIPSKVEESRGITTAQFRGILRLRFASLRMTGAVVVAQHDNAS